MAKEIKFCRFCGEELRFCTAESAFSYWTASEGRVSKTTLELVKTCPNGCLLEEDEAIVSGEKTV